MENAWKSSGSSWKPKLRSATTLFCAMATEGRALYPCVCPGHTKGVVELHYAPPTPDGVFFISACLDKLPMLRDGVTGDWIGTFQGHKGAVWSAKLNHDATRAATGSADFTVKLWDAVTGDDLATLEHGHVVRCVDFSDIHGGGGGSGVMLATGGQDKKLRLWALDNGGRVTGGPAVTVGHPDRIRKVAWAGAGAGAGAGAVITGSEDGVVRLVDPRLPEATAIVREAALGAGAVSDVEVSRAGDDVVTVAAGSCVAFLDAASLEVRARHSLGFQVETASLHPGPGGGSASGKHFVAGGTDVWVRLFDRESGAELVCQKGHHGTVHCLRFSPDGSTYGSGADDATIRLWRYDPDVQPASVTAASAEQSDPAATKLLSGAREQAVAT